MQPSNTGGTDRYRRAIAATCLLALAALGLPAVSHGATTTISGAPMTLIMLDTQGGRHQIRWNGARQVYPNNDSNGDSGITLFFNGTSYGFTGNATGGLVGANQFGISSQSALLGAGTAANPWRVVTTFTTDGTVTITQTVYYVNGDNFATFKWSFASTASYSGVEFYHAVDAFPNAQDNGFGAFNAACNGLSVSYPQVSPNFFEEFIPITAASAYREAVYSTGWNAVRSGTLNNTVNTSWHDAWMAFEWDFNLTAGAYRSIFQKVAFGGTACSATNAPPPYLFPTVAIAAAATPNPVTTGTTTALSVLGADEGGEANLTYTWAVTSGPSGTTFNANGTNAAKNSTATFPQAGTYTIQVTVADQDGFTVTSSVVVVVQQSPTSVTVTPPSATIDPNATQAFAAVLRDQFGDPMASQPAFTWMVSGGGSIDGSGLFTAGGLGGGPFTVTATGSSVSGTASVTIQNDAPTIAVAAAASPNPVMIGTATALSVLGADDGGEANLTYTWVVTAGPSGVTFGANGTNAAKSSSATFPQAGSYTIQVTVIDQDGQSATDAVIVVVQQSPTSVTVTPAAATIDPNATQAFTAVLNDQFDDPMAPQPTFTWMVSGGGTIDASGLFTAGGLGGGPFTVTATGSSVSGMASVTIQNDAPTIAVAAAASPNPVTTGTTTALSVLGADDGGEPNLTYTWVVTAGSSGVTFSANGTNAAKSSTATFSQAGTYTFQVTIADQDGLTATSQVVVLVDQAVSSVGVSPPSAILAPNATQAFTAVLDDQFGDPMASQPAFTWMVSGGGTIDASGLFTAGGNAGGPFTVTATDPGSSLQGTAAVTIGNSAPTLAVAAAAAPNPVTTGTTTALSALGADDGGEANLTYTWAVTSGPSGVTFSANGSNGAKSSTATFLQAGTYTFEVTVADQDDLTATGQVVVVVEQHASTIVVSPASAIVDPNAAQAFTAELRDQFDDPMATQPTFTWMVSGGGTIDASGLFTAGGNAGGPFTVTATDPGSSLQGTASVTIGSNAPTLAVAASAMPNPVTTGTTTSLGALGADDGGEANLTYTWAVTAGPSGVTFSANGSNAAKSSTATFPRAGTYTFEVTVVDEDGLSVTSQVVVVVEQDVAGVVASPPSATVGLNGTTTFTATASDQFGDALTAASFAWSVDGGGTIDPTGTFHAGTSPGGPFTVTASVGTIEGTASVTVVDLPPFVVIAPSAEPDPDDPSIQTLDVLAGDDGGEPNLAYSWSASGPGAVTFADDNTNTAKTTAGTFSAPGVYTVTVSIRDASDNVTTAALMVTIDEALVVSDANLYVRKGKFSIAWNQHARGQRRDAIALAGFINPAGLPASLAGTTLELTIGGSVVASGTLSDAGTFIGSTSSGARQKLRLSSKSGKYSVKVSRDDLRPALALVDESARRTLEVPVTLSVSRARTATMQNRLEFSLASVQGRRARGSWRGPRQPLLDGAFQALRTKAAFSQAAGGYVLQMRGVIYTIGSEPVIPTGDVTVRIADGDPVVIPLASFLRGGASDATSVWKFAADKTAPVSGFVLKNARRAFKLKAGRVVADTMGLTLGSSLGTRGDVALRLEIPTAAGTVVFQTTPELVRFGGSDRWKRPAPLLR